MRRLIVISLLLAGLAAPLSSQTEAEDRGLLQRLIEDNLSAAGREVRITGFRGALSSQASLDEMTIADDSGVWITLREVTLDWTRSALLRGRIEVNRLSAREIDLPRLPQTEETLSPEMAEAKPFSLPDLPVSVDIGEISADTLTLGAPILGEEVALRLLGRLSLGSGEGAARIDVTRLDGRGELILDAAFANETRVLALDLSLREDAGGIAATLLNLPDRPALELSVMGEAPLSDYAADIRLASDGEPRLTGAVTIRAEGPPETPGNRFTANLSGDLTPLFAPEYRPFFGPDSQLALTGLRRADGALDISEFTLSAAQLNLGGTLSLDAAGWPTGFALTGQVGDGQTPVRLPLSGQPTRLLRADLDARFDAARGDRWRARIALDRLEQADLGIARGTLSARGAIRRNPPRGITALTEFDLTGLRLSDPALAQAAGTALSGHASIDWTENKPLHLLGLQLTADGARLSGNGRIAALTEGFPVSGAFTVEAPDLTRFAALAGQEMAGAARATIAGSGRLLGGDFTLTLDAETDGLALGIAQLDPLIASPGRLSLAARRDTTGTDLDRLLIANDTFNATASGRLNSQSGALTIAARLTDLALSDRRLDGPAEVSTNIAWTSGGDLTLTGLDASLMGARIQATGTLSPETPGVPASGSLTAAFSDLSRFNALSGQTLRGTLDLDLEGSAEAQGQSFSVTTTLKGENLATGIPDLDRLIAGRLNLAASAGRTPENIQIERLTLDTPQLSLTARSATPGAPLDITARLANLGLFAPEFSGPVTATGRATLLGPEARQITLDLAADGPGGTTARLTGDVIDHGQRLDMAATGALPLALANTFITPNALQGTAQYDLRLNGAPSLGALSGTLTTTGTRIALPATGLAVDDLSGTATLGQSRAQTDFTARMRDGGQIRITGPVNLTPGFNGDLAVGLSGLVLSDQLIYTTTANGDVTLSGPLAGGARIGGAITLGETNIRIPSGLGPASVTLPDLRHVNEPPEVRATRQRAGLIVTETGGQTRPFGLDLFISAPNRIFVRGRGLDAELGGRLRIAGTTDAVAPDGFFELIRGRFDILGTRLDLTQGRVTMQGSLDPYLRFVAETQTGDITVQVIIEGLASAPEITFTSDPFLPEEEVIARLIFGRGLDNISAFQAAQLASAVATLSGNSDNDIVGRLRGAVGLSDLDVTQTEEGDTEVSAGGYISDRVYTEITADSAGRQQINLNLDLTGSVTAKGSASNDGSSGIGIFFEKDY
ncbi:autotransporter secretion inner membrane protein TamB [Roseovarius azorensis]|uniref:Autotransporter secretion inner membrane protein TamB n=1 Tax=Roseovarius azorensis TaxID=1287727 RepID=A0A1H7LF57_9RHOB|nr:translocation/assembly module TamB domain-containing protein [Roseovarius azorensis]SEK97470.1 autotransporter secretion inner membrane protein TamB [Roseovarius azorensis]